MDYFCVECGNKIENYNEHTTVGGYVDQRTGDIYFCLMCTNCIEVLQEVNDRISTGL